MELYRTKAEVHNRALEAVGKTVKELNGGEQLGNSHKSGVGDAFEAWFGKSKDSDREPDMREAGVELKATPIKQNKNGTLSAKERLVLNIINYEEVVHETFEESHFLHKNGTIELGFYRWESGVPKDDFIITDVALYEMSKNEVDFAIIKKDWEIIDSYIKKGQAHDLSERLTTYLSPCTKGASAKSVRRQPYSDIMAKQRAYSLKNGYMTYLYNTYVLGNEQSEAIVTNPLQILNRSLEDIILDRFTQYMGKAQGELMDVFGVNKKSAPNSRNPEIVKGMLGLKSDPGQAQEIQKANIKLKTIVVNKGATQNKEEFKLLDYKIAEVSKETWDESELKELLEDTKFLFIVFEKDGDDEIFKGVKFWEMPHEDIENKVRYVWEDTVNKLNSGVEITYNPKKRTTNFLNSSEENILFSKVSASKASYQKGNPNSDRLPVPAKWINRPEEVEEEFQDYYITKQAWWLNKKYMYNVIKDLLIDE